MEINKEFYSSKLGQKVSSIIHETSVMLLDRNYNNIPCDNIEKELDPEWISALDEMLRHYFLKLLPWAPGHDSTRVLVDAVDFFVVEAPLRHDDNGRIEDADLHMTFQFGHDGHCRFDGLHY